MNKKVIYVSWMHLSDKVSRDWYIDYLIENGINVEFWNVIPLLRGEFDEPATKTASYVRSFQTYSAFEAMLRSNKNSNVLYVILISYNGQTTKIFSLMSKYKCRMWFFAWGAYPISKAQKLNKVMLSALKPWGLVTKVFFKFEAVVYKKLKLVKPFEIIFTAGSVMTNSNQFATKIIPTNSADFDLYRKTELAGIKIVDGHYVVFLDVYLPYHSDLKLISGASVNPEVYYASLNRFFALIEVKYAVKVVIAAHPRADYRTNPFDGREIYLNQTAGLVKYSDFVLTHQSTSLSYAVLNHKPIIFVYTNEMTSRCRYTVMGYLFSYSSYLDAAIYNIDEIAQGGKIDIREVKLKNYNEYKYNYLTTRDTENTTTQEIFLREIMSC